MRHSILSLPAGAPRATRPASRSLGAALALAGCGGDSSGGPTNAAATRRRARPALRRPAPSRTSSASTRRGSSRARAASRRRSRQCMKNEGFDYIPVDPFAQRAALVGTSRLSDEEFLKQFGYGISTLWGRGNAQADPNERLRATLGAADRRAYDRALWGDNTGATFSEAVDSGDFDRARRLHAEGHRGRLRRRPGPDAAAGQARRARRADPRGPAHGQGARDAGRRAWRTRATATRTPTRSTRDLFRRTEKIVGPLPGQFATGPPAGQRPRPYDHAALASLQHEEVAIARRDNACEQKDIDAGRVRRPAGVRGTVPRAEPRSDQPRAPGALIASGRPGVTGRPVRPEPPAASARTRCG